MRMQAKRIIIMIDGGYLRVCARKNHFKYDPDFIERTAHGCRGDDEEVLRILYYDCAPYAETVKLPVSGKEYKYRGSDAWLNNLGQKDLFAVRRGVLKFRGFVPKRIAVARYAHG